MKPCQSCSSWAGCSGKSWYSISELRFCRFQTQWVINNFLTVDGDAIVVINDLWPPEGRETGYTDGPQHFISAHAAFERPMQIVAEVHWRLERTKQDGKLLVLQVKSDVNLGQAARDALAYCSGWRRKRLGYSAWKKQRNWRDRPVLIYRNEYMQVIAIS